MSAHHLRPVPSAAAHALARAVVDVFCLVAEYDGALAGQVTVLPAARGPQPVAGSAVAHLRNLSVERAFWGTGVARSLNAAAIEGARELVDHRYALRSERPAASS